MPASNWYVVRVRSNFEQRAATALQAKGLTIFLPLYRVKRRWSDRVKEMDVPLFPGYVFCRFNPHEKLPILQTPGIVSIIGTSNGPTPVEDSEIAAVQTMMKSGLAVGPWPFLREGQPVIVKYGALEGLEGLILSSKGKHRLIVSISLLQRSVSVEIDRECVAPLAPDIRGRAA